MNQTWKHSSTHSSTRPLQLVLVLALWANTKTKRHMRLPFAAATCRPQSAKLVSLRHPKKSSVAVPTTKVASFGTTIACSGTWTLISLAKLTTQTSSTCGTWKMWVTLQRLTITLETYWASLLRKLMWIINCMQLERRSLRIRRHFMVWLSALEIFLAVIARSVLMMQSMNSQIVVMAKKEVELWVEAATSVMRYTSLLRSKYSNLMDWASSVVNLIRLFK